MKLVRVAVVYVVLAGGHVASADVASVEAFGLSAHLGASYADAPRGLDADGIYVFNPGVGVEWDFRDHVANSGVSPIVKASWFQDCDDRAVYAALGGVRYWHAFSNGLVLGGSLSLALVNGEDWDTGERVTTVTAAPIVEVGHLIGTDYLARFGIVYAPPNAAISATANDGLLFFMASFGGSVLD